jgi:hypothetical protein
VTFLLSKAFKNPLIFSIFGCLYPKKMRFRLLSTLFLCFLATASLAQSHLLPTGGHISGSFQLNQNFYQRDSTIGAAGNPLYDNVLSGGEGWLNLLYASNNGFTANVRFDLFNNSNLHNPSQNYSAQGVGFWNASKEIGNGITILGGYFYDQFGSGIVYRSYEDRGLGIDNSTFGFQVKGKFLHDNLYIKAFSGRQKNLFTTYNPVIKGANAEYYVDFGPVQITPGASIVNRTLDANSIAAIVTTINSYTRLDSAGNYVDRFIPKYNTYAYSFYNTVNWGNFSLFAEYAGKTSEAIYNNVGKLTNTPGSVLFTSLNYSVKGFGATAQFKRTDHFVFRTSPNEQLLKGMISFQPPLSKQNSLRLPARYMPATQELGELAYEADFFYTPKKGIKTNGNYTYITLLNKQKIYEEISLEVEIKKSKNNFYDFGFQFMNYSLAIYRGKPLEPMLVSYIPYAEWTHRFTEKKSIRVEAQYQETKQDYGSWIFGLIEYNIAPRWSFALSDMYNIKPNPYYSTTHKQAHYYNCFVSFTEHATRLTLAYVKQVDGIVCTGGVCRYEPAFSGLKFTLNTTF